MLRLALREEELIEERQKRSAVLLLGIHSRETNLSPDIILQSQNVVETKGSN